MNDSIIYTDTLAKMSGLTRARDIEKWLEKQGIKYFPGKKGPSTTIDLLNASKGLAQLPETTAESII